jgi:hypothetical protein
LYKSPGKSNKNKNKNKKQKEKKKRENNSAGLVLLVWSVSLVLQVTF